MSLRAGEGTKCVARQRAGRPSAPWPACLLAAIAATLLLAGCGGGENPIEIRVKDESVPSHVLGFPVLATKNTTRVAGENPAQDAAGVASAVYPSIDGRQPRAVILVDKEDWRAGIAAAALAAPPISAPILLTDGGLPDPSSEALKLLRPTGSALAGRAQAFSIGDAARPDDLRTTRVAAKDPFSLAAQVDAFRTRTTGRPSADVVIVAASDPRFAMPAAAWAAKSGDAVLLTATDTLPEVTRRAIADHQRPGIYVLGPKRLISETVVEKLRRLGPVTRIGAETPVQNAIAFARFSDRGFGWGIQDPGHGLVIANTDRPLDAVAAAPLSGSGTYGPLLLTDSAKVLPAPLSGFLLDIQPGYRSDPVRGVYNHAWLIGDESAISVALQTDIDELTEIVHVKQGPSQ